MFYKVSETALKIIIPTFIKVIIWFPFMRKLIAGVTALLTFATFSPNSIASETTFSESSKGLQVETQYEELQESWSVAIKHATSLIEEGKYNEALSDLNTITKHKKTSHNITIEDIASRANYIIKKYEFICAYKPDLLNLANAIYIKQKAECASHLLLKGLSKVEAFDNFKYHICTAYNLSLKTKSIKKTHEELQAFYDKESFSNKKYNPEFNCYIRHYEDYGDQVKDIFSHIENSLPKSSSLIEKINSKYKCRQKALE